MRAWRHMRWGITVILYLSGTAQAQLPERPISFDMLREHFAPVSVTVSDNTQCHHLDALLAESGPQRARGLMFVRQMPKMSGLLFYYPQPRQMSMWMKNTLISLDMIFADETGTVQKVHENAEPLSERLINGGRDIQYVLEVNGGVAARFGIGPGDQLRHPSIDQDGAAWPCE